MFPECRRVDLNLVTNSFLFHFYFVSISFRYFYFLVYKHPCPPKGQTSCSVHVGQVHAPGSCPNRTQGHQQQPFDQGPFNVTLSDFNTQFSNFKELVSLPLNRLLPNTSWASKTFKTRVPAGYYYNRPIEEDQ